MITEDNRFSITDELWHELCQIINNPEVAKRVPEIIERIARLGKEGMSVVYPTGKNTEDTDGWVLIKDYFEAVGSNADKSSQIMLYPMFPEDAVLGQVASYYVERVSGAAYGSESNTIVINMSCFKEKPRFLAHCFIHELGHAQTAKKERRLYKKNLRSPNERLREEIYMWTMDYKLMLALGGKNYRNASKKMAFKINQWWRQKKACPNYRGMGITLKHYFGNLSDADLDNESDFTFFVYCSFMAADYYLTGEKSKAKKLQILQKINIAQYDIEKNFISSFSKR